MKPLERFHFSNKRTGRRRHICAECFTVYRREHYRRNRAAYVERNTRLLRQRRLDWQRRLWEYLLEHPCVDCGEADPVVLEFDHVEPRSKRLAMQDMVQGGYAWPTVLTELAKCDVRCANCHRMRTAAQFGWPKLVARRE